LGDREPAALGMLTLVINALIRNASKFPQELYKTLTWDRSNEMVEHTRFTVAYIKSLLRPSESLAAWVE
jgi:hypothetical protein